MRLIIDITTVHLDRDGHKERRLRKMASNLAKSEGKMSFISEFESS